MCFVKMYHLIWTQLSASFPPKNCFHHTTFYIYPVDSLRKEKSYTLTLRTLFAAENRFSLSEPREQFISVPGKVLLLSNDSFSLKDILVKLLWVMIFSYYVQKTHSQLCELSYPQESQRTNGTHVVCSSVPSFSCIFTNFLH